MLRASDITSFHDASGPPGASAYLPGCHPSQELTMTAYDPEWVTAYERLAALIKTALGSKLLAVHHVGSTAVPGLAAKPIIDVDLTVADVNAEASYVPPLEAHGFQHAIREPWWYGHRLLRHRRPRCNLHVWAPDCAEAARHLIFRDWLRDNSEDRDLYEQTKRRASEQTVAAGGDVEVYNSQKQAVIRQIYARAFTAHGLA